MRARVVLVACTACRRHLRACEPRCPFCGAARVPSTQAPARVHRVRDRRAALALAASLSSLGVAGCRTQLQSPPEAGAPTDAAVDSASPVDEGNTQPPFDFTVPETVDLSGGQPIYGSPPPRDPDP